MDHTYSALRDVWQDSPSRQGVTVVKKAVHRYRGEQRVPKERVPFGDVAVGCDDGGTSLVALAYDLVQVHRLVVGERLKAEVVDDEEPWAGEACQPPLVGRVGSRCTQRREHFVGGHIERRLSRHAGPMSDRLRQMGLADTRRFDKEDVGVSVEEASGGPPHERIPPKAWNGCLFLPENQLSSLQTLWFQLALCGECGQLQPLVPRFAWWGATPRVPQHGFGGRIDVPRAETTPSSAFEKP